MTANDNAATVLYALPDGQIIKAPDHMRDAVERFQMADRSLVWAVRVTESGEEAARRAARAMAATAAAREGARLPRGTVRVKW